jgi:hypothetical protein
MPAVGLSLSDTEKRRQQDTVNSVGKMVKSRTVQEKRFQNPSPERTVAIVRAATN